MTTLTKTRPAALSPEAWARQVVLDDEPRDLLAGDGPAPDQPGDAEPDATAPVLLPETPDGRPVLAVFCYEEPDSFVGQYVRRAAALVARRGVAVHLFARGDCPVDELGVRVHVLGRPESEEGLVESVQDYARRASAAFARLFPDPARSVTLLAHDWSAVPAALTVQERRGLNLLVEYHSVESQRSDVSSDLARQIADIERAGLHAARTILVHQHATREHVRGMVPECAERIEEVAEPFPAGLFETPLDPGEVKARCQIGPVDPTILYVGDLSGRYGPDLLVKALPAVLKNHTQVRLALVGGGQDLWPLRVYARYLLLDHAVRFVGDVQGRALFDLVQAADMVVVPSREPTPWWPIQAAWAARCPVVATHNAAPGLVDHEQDGVLVYPSESSLVWGIERILFDRELAGRVAVAGQHKLRDRFGDDLIAAQLTRLMGVAAG